VNANEPSNNQGTVGTVGDYHLFIRIGDKLYMEAKGVGEIVISFEALQNHKYKYSKYWKQYYDLSLMLSNDPHLVVEDIVDDIEDIVDDIEDIVDDIEDIVDDIEDDSEDNEYKIYEEKRRWSIDTSFIDTYKVVKTGDVCYYKINPFDLDNMEYTSQEDLNTFEETYTRKRGKVLYETLEIYNEIARTIVRNE
jgi:Mg2+ and Co2+ transporter CorA